MVIIKQGSTPTILIEKSPEIKTYDRTVFTFEDAKGFKKDFDNPILEGDNFKINLTQEDTLSLAVGTVKLEVQYVKGDSVAITSTYSSIYVVESIAYDSATGEGNEEIVNPNTPIELKFVNAIIETGEGGGGTTNHALLSNLSYEQSNHTGFQASLSNEQIDNIADVQNKADKTALQAVKETADSALQTEIDPTVPSWAKQANKPTYTAEEVNALPDTTVIPTELPNPNALTFTGAVSATYDGSTAVSVNIPQGGQGGTTVHSELSNLEYAKSGHTGFQSALSVQQLANIEDVPNKANASALTAYSTTAQMNTAISNALSTVYTKEESEQEIATALTPYSTTAQVNTTVATALTPYSTTADMNTAISEAINTSITQVLEGSY